MSSWRYNLPKITKSPISKGWFPYSFKLPATVCNKESAIVAGLSIFNRNSFYHDCRKLHAASCLRCIKSWYNFPSSCGVTDTFLMEHFIFIAMQQYAAVSQRSYGNMQMILACDVRSRQTLLSQVIAGN